METVDEKIERYAQYLVKNEDFTSCEQFNEELASDKAKVIDWVRWRALGGTMFNEKPPIGYEEACREILRLIISPEDIKAVEIAIENADRFNADIQSNGYRMTKNLKDNYICLLDGMKGNTVLTLAEISQEYHHGSADKSINAIGSELKMQELQRIEEMEQCR